MRFLGRIRAPCTAVTEIAVEPQQSIATNES